MSNRSFFSRTNRLAKPCAFTLAGDEHDAVVRSSHHLHRSALDDVHLFTDVALQRDTQDVSAEVSVPFGY
ncbi:hypothetical protein EYF80_066864 [Liparis tanakae]|uniref:Uncharacterized protein n=1 Tax=Liparis tanakae TaxID=230148 RepID=A0A4Z2E2P7_9TELE|nr:hypothetical protein EYF80_066864 [Liparis tanakae]